MSDGVKLEACPFCASEQIAISPCETITDDIQPEVTWATLCKACGARLDRDTEAEAIAAWNTRKSDDGWRTMESAPKDGTDVLVYYWNDACVAGFYGLAYPPHYEAEAEGIRVTAWQPLPSPPEG